MTAKKLSPDAMKRPVSRRKLRTRPTPKWLLMQQELDGVAQRRCLMVLSVLSGEKPVTEAITEGGISRGTYYQLEEKALKAMLSALMPGVETGSEGGPAVSHVQRVAQLEARVTKLEKEKRRAERLLQLTRKVLKPGLLKVASGRPTKKKAGPSSTTTGATPSPKPSSATMPSTSPSTPTTTSEAVR